MVFSRVQLLPRFMGADGDGTRVVVEQAFGRLVPFDSQELALSVGKFDSVFGIEYLDNQANIRTGITPSLIARYTTGQSIGAKLFYRVQIAPLWSALSLNVAATNSGNFVESLQPPDASLTGTPVASGRLGYELNTPVLQVEAGRLGDVRSAQRPVRAHRRTRSVYGADAAHRGRGPLRQRRVRAGRRRGGRGRRRRRWARIRFRPAFSARGGYVQLAYALTLDLGRAAQAHRSTRATTGATPGSKGSRRSPSTVSRAGCASISGSALILKGEYLVNRELAGAPTVANNVITSSLVYSW